MIERGSLFCWWGEFWVSDMVVRYSNNNWRGPQASPFEQGNQRLKESQGRFLNWLDQS